MLNTLSLMINDLKTFDNYYFAPQQTDSARPALHACQPLSVKREKAAGRGRWQEAARAGQNLRVVRQRKIVPPRPFSFCFKSA